MQARGALPDILVRITERRRQRLAGASGSAPHPALPARTAPLTATENRFLGALAKRRGRAIIAEVKMGSPSLGSLAQRLNPVELARTYAAHGAAALSVVVEPDFFHGSYDLLTECRQASGLPALAKDFIVSPAQLHWAREAGAEAVLLIAALYSPTELASYAGMARQLGLAPLVETYRAEELSLLEGASWEVVGVNHRDLRTFRVDLDHSRGLLPGLPPEAVKVAESGIRGAADVERLRTAGFDAFLVGESLLLADDPAAKLRELSK
jgi:indole-3-glycerol phosphate synthase